MERPLRALTEAKVKHDDTSKNFGALIDSRADKSLTEWDFALSLVTEPLEVLIDDHHKHVISLIPFIPAPSRVRSSLVEGTQSSH